MRWISPWRMAPGLPRRLAIALALGAPAAAAHACQITTPNTVTVGTFSPAAIKTSAVPLQNAFTKGGFSCASTGIVALLSGNYLKATIPAGTVFQLTSGSNTVTYKLYADPAGAASTELKANATTFYVNGTALNLLNLTGSGAIDAPIYFKLASTGFVPAGTYTGSFTIRWDWYFCQGIGLFDACILGTPDQGFNKVVTVNVTLYVAANPPTVSVTVGPTTWNVVEGTNKPKAIPGAKRRISLTITNPDYATVEADTIQVVLPTPANMTVALDGDGTGGAVIQTAEGSPVSNLTLPYVDPTNSGDNVDFFAAGSGWSYGPIAGNAASQDAVTQVRFRPKGTMAGLSSYTITIPYSVK